MGLTYNGTNVQSVKYNNTDLTKVIYNGTTVWEKAEPTEYTGLCFTANTAGSTVELCKHVNALRTLPIANTAYSTDGTNWTTFTPSATSGTNVITLTNAGDKVYFRNDITGNFESVGYLKFVMSGSIAASGNCNSMYDSTNFESLTTLTYTYCFNHLFFNCTSLTTAPALPATTLATYCYSNMFNGCTSLATAPTLSATTLASNCYYYIFKGCTSLTTAPALPATTLANNCYYNMFYNCGNLWASDTQTTKATYAWNIPTSGTFTNTTAYEQISMFYDCLGTRSSDDMSGAYGESHTYYTQNQPV